MMRRLDALAALVAVVAFAFLACSEDPTAVPQSGGTTTTEDRRGGAGSREAPGAVVAAPGYTSPTTTTTTEPAPVVPATAGPPSTAASGGSCGGWRNLVAAHFANVAESCSVLMCESNGNPSAYNPSGASGLYQVMPLWAEDYERVTGVPYYDGRFNGPANVAFAAWLFGQSGTWAHWECKP